MKQEMRIVKYDAELKVEAYHFQGIMQKFPNHFHEYYVIGFIEKGQRFLSCKNKEYTIEPGDLLIFNPRDNHTCEQIDGKTLDYRCINIQPEIMSKAVLEITGKEYLPYFTTQVVFHSELVSILRELHQMLMEEEKDFRKEELFFFLLEQLIEEYTEQTVPAENIKLSTETRAICEFLEKHYMETITLADLCNLTGLSKYYLLRSFTKQKGISPYSYLETIRIDKAKKMLEKGMLPINVALSTGFTDQSHFSNFFKKFIGLTPKQYMSIFKDSQS
ncbi:DNA-binding domain-containing protein, AraC-type [Desulfitobacterium dehalogenans ATCC 51507]|uniref:DNA-binding domain-containing protein, AraC-type n=1 Tax=Desulfitobacterium dehalogenans (strain ATCC 51507 / DSM 9161 / JW/IU-DC1) TaxID=756499 RepID=I4A9D5_DESDJ|nr:AraC family transcriptional regulator [Desulfitobacterium dehalogenans]AFM00570.1 DNA-binding domain-containing protein, AraC-type [Desulfitobacterium dehalogenans ATCC 51507]